MKGIVKLKVPAKPMTPKLFIVTLSWQGCQYRFSRVAWDLKGAIDQNYVSGHRFTINDYITHSELTVDEINSLFKHFNP